MAQRAAGDRGAPGERPPLPADLRAPEHLTFGGRRLLWPVVRRAAIAFYDDQMTQHAGALTYYALMSLFPAMLLGLSVLGLVGEYPRTYDAVVDGLDNFAPPAVVDSLDDSIRQAIERKGTAATALAVSVVVGFYGTTGVLEAARRALNVVFEVEQGRGFLHRKLVDVGSTIVLMALVGFTLALVFGGARLVRPLIGDELADVWTYARWPVAFMAATLAFAWLYYVTADRRRRRFRAFTPGAVVGVLAWFGVSAVFADFVTRFPAASAIYGAFATAILVVGWLWLTNVCLLFGAELDASIERQRLRPAGT